MTDVPDFTGRPDEYLAWAADHARFNPHFCTRHWMPCPVDGKPGLVTSVIMMTEALGDVDWMPLAARTSSEAMNSYQANKTTPYCCFLGDEKMAWLWWMLDQEHCRANSGRGERVCWRRPGHDGVHEWERPYPRSVFDLMAEWPMEATA